MNERLVGALILVLTLALCLTSCGTGREDAQSDGVTLVLMGKTSDLAKSYVTSIFEQYKSTSGNQLEIIACEDADFETAALKKFERGDAPDILLHFNNANLNRFNIEDNFYYLNDEAWVDDLTDGVRTYCQDGQGNLLGLPFWENSISGCYYNKTLLNTLGLKPATTQAEFDMLCQALAGTGYTPICWPGDKCTWMFQFPLDPVFADNPSLLQQLNANAVSYTDIPQMKDMVQWIADAANRGWFGDHYLETGWSDIGPTLASGKAVMTFIWDTWFYTDFAQGGKYSIEDFALMPVFMNTVENGTYEGGNLNMMMVNKNSKHLETALEFLSFCASPDHYNTAFDGIATVNCFKGQTSNIQSPMVTEAKASIAANERASTAASKIIGYSADDMFTAVDSLLRKQVDVSACVKLMDNFRVSTAQKEGVAEFQVG